MKWNIFYHFRSQITEISTRISFLNPSIYLIIFSDDFLTISKNDFDDFDDFFRIYDDFMRYQSGSNACNIFFQFTKKIIHKMLSAGKTEQYEFLEKLQKKI